MDNDSSVATSPVVTDAEAQRLFPTLTPRQIDRMAASGRRRASTQGDVLVNVGDKVVPLFVVTSGTLEIEGPSGEAPTLIVRLGPGQFTGEGNLITGRPSLARIRVATAGEVIEVPRDRLLSLVQTDAELSAVLMRSFMLRRQALIARDLSDVIVIGSTHSAGTLRVKEFLTRNGHPFHYIDLDRDADAQQLLDRFAIDLADIPVMICRGDAVLRNPSNQRIADCLGFNNATDSTRVADLAIIGAGPAGLAAAVYGASEGLDVLVLEAASPGGQAGTSSRIENYLGFPTGVSGLDLTARAYAQAQKFGAQVLIARSVTGLACDRQPYTVRVDGGSPIQAQTVVIATGAGYRKPALENLSKFEGAGVYYAATTMEAQLCAGDDVIVVGGGNSAGQAAVFLAGKARRVHILVRADGLADTMSRYLIRRIEEDPGIELHTRTQMVALDGDEHLETVQWQNGQTGVVETHPIRHVFLMIGAVPNTAWLSRCLVLDDKGFVKTGQDLSADDLKSAGWPLSRPPYLLETSRPGVFAVGDVRAGNIKRVASAVGEGSIAVSFVHQVLQKQ
jgi:thioredoxin reductase (NADPH)